MDWEKVQAIITEFLAGATTTARRAQAIKALVEEANVSSVDAAENLLSDAFSNPSQYNVAAGTIPSAGSGEQARVIKDILGGAERGVTAAGRGLEILRRQGQIFGSGPFAPFVEQGLNRRFNPQDINSQFNLDLFGGTSPESSAAGIAGRAPGGTFREFAGGLTGARPNAQVLAMQLRNILEELERGESEVTDFTEALQSEFKDPRVAFRAALQPALANISPSLRSGFIDRAEGRFLDQLAKNQGQFATPVQTFRQLAPRFSLERF